VSLTTRTTLATPPISLAEMKTFLKITSTADDALITSMIEAATAHCEAYCGRDVRANVYRLLTTDFGDVAVTDFPYRVSPFNFAPLEDTTLHIKRATIASIDSVEYLLSDVWTAIPTTVWYASIRPLKTFLLLKQGQGWPTDADEVEDNVRIDFTMAVPDNVSLAIAGIYRHVGRMYEERGDCEPQMAGALANQTAKSSGAEGMYQSLQVPRF